MSLTLVTGPVRSGKSDLGQRLAAAGGRPVTIAVAGAAVDAEMEARIARHRALRPSAWVTLELTPAVLTAPAGPATWLASIPEEHALVVDCLGTLLSALLVLQGELGDDVAAPDVQAAYESDCAAVTHAIAERPGETIVVSNEVGWGVVPGHPAGRLFRDALGRANRTLTGAADRALLVVTGRVVDLKSFPSVEEYTL